jgi:hypothetical protein
MDDYDHHFGFSMRNIALEGEERNHMIPFPQTQLFAISGLIF